MRALIMKLKHLLFISTAAISLGVAFSMPVHAIQGSAAQANQSSQAGRSYLNGSFVGWNQKGELITTVGTYSVDNVYVSDRMGTRASTYQQKNGAPQVTLEFSSDRLIKVIIY